MTRSECNNVGAIAPVLDSRVYMWQLLVLSAAERVGMGGGVYSPAEVARGCAQQVSEECVVCRPHCATLLDRALLEQPCAGAAGARSDQPNVPGGR